MPKDMVLTKECESTPLADSICNENIDIRTLETWPRGWRAYRALLGGFLLMFNSWYRTLSIPYPGAQC